MQKIQQSLKKTDIKQDSNIQNELDMIKTRLSRTINLFEQDISKRNH